MVKRRVPMGNNKLEERLPTPEEIDVFADAADGGKTTPTFNLPPRMHPHAKRGFKSIRLPFNEFEFNKLEKLATKHGRTKLSYIRWALEHLSEDIEDDDVILKDI
tara:strand:- start:1694 stop:2008 length:315 start_codon:yes stop_codon:yes gene_type:complete